MDTGDITSPPLPHAASCTRARPDDIVLSEEGVEDRRRFSPTGCGSSTRSTAPTSSASTAATTGPCTSPCGSAARSPPAPCRLPALELVFATDPAPVLPAVDRERPRLVTSRNRATRTRRWSSPTRSAPTPCASVRPGPRRWRSSSARPTSTSTTAGCTSGTRPPRRRWRWPPGCTSAASTGRRWSTTRRPVAPRLPRVPHGVRRRRARRPGRRPRAAPVTAAAHRPDRSS